MRRFISRFISSAILVAGLAAGQPSQVSAADLVIGLREVQMSTDPHFMTSPAAFQVNSQIYEPLLRRDDDVVPRPWLAEKWELLDETTWVFHLRKDVKWHDGTPFTADDVAFTYERAPNVPNTPTSFKTYLSPIKKAEVIDAHTLKIHTDGPSPSLLEKLAYVLIVSRKHGQGNETGDYNSGKGVIGTGPYKFQSWTQNERTIVVKNPDYWGTPPEWDKVTYRMMTNDSSRVAALMAGDIDVAESVASQDIDALSRNPNTKVWKRITGRIGYVTFDAGAQSEGKITGPNGEKLDPNPLADVRVRNALAEAIDVNLIAERIYRGEAEPTAQYLPPGIAGHDTKIPLRHGNPERGKKLLEETGWAGKFKVTIMVATGFFPQSVQAAEAVAQQWTRAGAQTSVETVPLNVFLLQSRDRKVPVYVSSYQNSTGTADNYYPTFFHTKTGAWGTLNSFGYSDPKTDEMIEQAARTMNDEKRAQLWRDVTHRVLETKIQIPMFFFYAVHASKKDLVVKMRGDRAILPVNVSRARG